jgi:hypothetical protein
MRSTSVTRSLLAAVAVASVTGAGCSKLVGVELAVAEPCGQELQALNGVQSYRVVSSGSSQDGVVAFTATQPAGVAIGLRRQHHRQRDPRAAHGGADGGGSLDAAHHR